MLDWIHKILVCPTCDGPLGITDGQPGGVDSVSCAICSRTYDAPNGILRFVPSEDYWQNFGYQWTHFARTQIDTFSGSTESLDRFKSETGWTPEKLRDKLVLDVGSGAGRFADVALRFGARVVAVDASTSVDACKKNLEDLGHDPQRFEVIQASLYSLPFEPHAFDFVYSIGVVQHTPDRRKSVISLARQLGDGELALWVYERSWRSLLGYKYWFRIVSKRLSRPTNWKLSMALVDIFFPLAWWMAKVPAIGHYLVRLLPMAFRSPGAHGTKRQSKEWSLLDTFDNLSPRYDHPITESELRQWLVDTGLRKVERLPTPGLAVVASRDYSAQSQKMMPC